MCLVLPLNKLQLHVLLSAFSTRPTLGQRTYRLIYCYFKFWRLQWTLCFMWLLQILTEKDMMLSAVQLVESGALIRKAAKDKA